MTCANCCGTCCAVLQFSGFDHPVPAEMFAWFQELSTNTPRNVNFFTFDTAAYQMEDGTYVKAVGNVSYDTAPRLNLTIQVFEPVQYVPDSKAMAYYRRHYNYSYRNTSTAGDKIINPCTHSLLEFLPEHVFATTVTQVAYVPDVGSQLTGSSTSIPSMSPAPAAPVPAAGGTFRIGMGRPMDNLPFYIEDDNWIHNIEEVVVELSSEIIGNDTFSNGAQVFPLSFEFSLQRAASSGSALGLPAGWDYIYDDNFDLSPYVELGGATSTNAIVQVRLGRWPACGFNGQLFVIARQLRAPFLGVASPAEPGRPSRQFAILANYTSSQLEGLTSGLAIFHDSLPPLGTILANERPRGIFYGDPSGLSVPLPSWWHKRVHTFSEAEPILRRRLRKCNTPPCDPLDRFDADGSFRLVKDDEDAPTVKIDVTEAVEPIFPPETFPLVVSPEDDFALPNAWTGRLHRVFPLAPDATPVTDTSEFVKVKCKLRILSVS